MYKPENINSNSMRKKATFSSLKHKTSYFVITLFWRFNLCEDVPIKTGERRPI